jgi:hypothetical protein
VKIIAILLHPPSYITGITIDPDRCKTEHDIPVRWHQWEADTETIARNIERHFITKGMKGDIGGGLNPTWVYIFM